MVGGSRIRQIGWALVLAVCFALLLALTFKVNAVKSDVRLAERQIIAAQRAKLMLETEFETRASQQQLSDWNAVEFGFAAWDRCTSAGAAGAQPARSRKRRPAGRTADG